MYRGSFERIYIYIYLFSPSIHDDDTWTAVKKHISDAMKADAEKEQIYYEAYDPVALKKIIETQHKVLDFQKENEQKEVFSVLIAVDDFADDPKFVRYSNILHVYLLVEGITPSRVFLSAQKYNEHFNIGEFALFIALFERWPWP